MDRYKKPIKAPSHDRLSVHICRKLTDTLAQFSTWIFRDAGAVGRLVGACRLLAFESISVVYLYF